MAGFSLPLVNPALGVAPTTPANMPTMPAPSVPAPTPAPAPAPMDPDRVPSVPSPLTPEANHLQSVLQQVLPILVSGIAAKRGGALAGSAMLRGYAEGQAEKTKRDLEHAKMQAVLDQTNLAAREKAAAIEREQSYKLAQFVQEMSKQIGTITDPATFASTVNLADQTAAQAFGAPPGSLKHAFVFSDQPRLAQEKKDAQATVDAFVKLHGPDALDQAMSAGALVGGKRLSDLVALTNYDVTLPSGERFQSTPDSVAVASEQDVAKQAVAEARKAARMSGKPFTQTDATRVSQQAIKQFKEATRLSPQSDSSTSGGGGEVKTDNDLKGDVQDTLEGRNTMYNIRQTMGRSNSAAAYMKKMRAMIRAVDPSFDFVASDAGGKSVSTSYVQRATAAINAVMPNIDRIIALSDQVKRVGVRGVDELLQRGKVQFGNKAVANFRQAQKLIADEIGVALGAGTVSDMKLQLGFDVTDPAVTPEVFASNMELVKEFIQNRKKGLEELRYRSSKTPDYSQAIPQAVHDALDGQPNGHTYTLSDGSKWIKGADGSIKAGG